MTDRELLELAARAAGYVEEWQPDGWTDEGPWRWFEAMKWNPLKDDGDALRLAVKLGISPIQDKYDNVCAAYWTDVHCCNVGYKSDPVAATRRAITRAAAHIQLNKEKQ